MTGLTRPAPPRPAGQAPFGQGYAGAETDPTAVPGRPGCPPGLPLQTEGAGGGAAPRPSSPRPLVL